MNSDKNTVYVARSAHAAASEPNFVIEHKGRFYVTVAVLEYDPHADDMTREQKRGIEQVRDLFEHGRRYATAAVPLEQTWEWTCQSTGPSLPKPPSPLGDGEG